MTEGNGYRCTKLARFYFNVEIDRKFWHSNIHGQRYSLNKNKRSKGIRQCPINLCTSPMMVHKIAPSVD